jgi:hypothetical protein
MLCDFAEVSGGKLFISGAGLALLASPAPGPPYRVNVSLAILGLIRSEDTGVQHKMTIELVQVARDREVRVMLADDLPEGGDPADRGMIILYFMAPRSAEMQKGDEWSMPMALPLYGLGLPQLGSYFFSVRVDGREMDRSSFRLLPAQELQLDGPPQGPPPEAAGPQGPPSL